MSQLHRALSFALQAHSGSDREGDSPLPYFTHPVEVLNNLRYVGGVTDPDLLCVAVLHDVVEESSTNLADIEAQFGQRVATLVKELTRREPGTTELAGLSKSEIWQLRSDLLLSEIARMSPDAQIVKLADRLANLREAKRTKREEKLKRYAGQTKRILEIIPESRNPALWNAIRREIAG